MKDFRDLLVWEKAHKIVLQVYNITTSFPDNERYGLTSQIRRSAVSIPSNIAEGCGRGTDADFARFIQISLGSASELEYQLLLAYDLDYLPKTIHQQTHEALIEVKRMLSALLKKLKADR